ncbi:hypothetical protein AJ79_08863 [Helicocarpus griseus UAMH5409]|uniref:Ricin B lectin domain-containing protein n=1 Tax=Helicocarpus griseus UAMH5409 TaxID=1447875 RepID=A0A2B7WP66_9EURO|nr:hypothetical protein AJ79_08863 [Helicocarpus griseus UAMH5409]
MKLNLFTVLTAAMAASVSAAPANEATAARDIQLQSRDRGHANFLELREESGLNRWRWQFAGASCDEFRETTAPEGTGASQNFQCWETDQKGTWNYDVSEAEGESGDRAVILGVVKVTLQSCCDMGLPDWAVKTCIKFFEDDGC